MLRRAYSLASCFLVFASITQLSIAQDPVEAGAKPTIEEVKVDFIPLIRDAARGAGGDHVLQDNWIAITVKFSTSAPFTDELTVKVYMDGNEDPGKQGYVVLSSQVTFVNVPPSKENMVKFYISPTSALRYGGKEGKDLKKSNVFVSISSGSEDPVTKMMHDDKSPLWYQQGRAVNDILMPFYETPWWPFEANMYNQFKKR